MVWGDLILEFGFMTLPPKLTLCRQGRSYESRVHCTGRGFFCCLYYIGESPLLRTGYESGHKSLTRPAVTRIFLSKVDRFLYLAWNIGVR